jgi:hypothetical protein
MLNRCKCPRVYLIVDALDVFQDSDGDSGMAVLLKLIVRTGHGLPSQIKWLLTSRPLNSAEQELLSSSDQVMVSLDLNTKHISQGVAIYISYKIADTALPGKGRQDVTSNDHSSSRLYLTVTGRLKLLNSFRLLSHIRMLPIYLNYRDLSTTSSNECYTCSPVQLKSRCTPFQALDLGIPVHSPPVASPNQ